MAVWCSLLGKSRTHFFDFSDLFKNKWRKEKEEVNQTNWRCSFWMSFVQMRPRGGGGGTPSVTSHYKTIFKQKILFIATLLTWIDWGGKKRFYAFQITQNEWFWKAHTLSVFWLLPKEMKMTFTCRAVLFLNQWAIFLDFISNQDRMYTFSSVLFWLAHW